MAILTITITIGRVARRDTSLIGGDRVAQVSRRVPGRAGLAAGCQRARAEFHATQTNTRCESLQQTVWFRCRLLLPLQPCRFCSPIAFGRPPSRRCWPAAGRAAALAYTQCQLAFFSSFVITYLYVFNDFRREKR